MEYLSHRPHTLQRYIPFTVNDFMFTFLDHMKVYCESNDIQGLYLYLNSLEEFQYKNIWNRVHEQWNLLLDRGIRDIPTFKRTTYYKEPKTQYRHSDFTYETFDLYLKEWIKGDMVRSIFIMEQLICHGRH